jgi:hypothetical protein
MGGKVRSSMRSPPSLPDHGEFVLLERPGTCKEVLGANK